MLVAVEPLAVAEERIRLKTFGPITAVKRLTAPLVLPGPRSGARNP
jgi:hypothetical protein